MYLELVQSRRSISLRYLVETAHLWPELCVFVLDFVESTRLRAELCVSVLDFVESTRLRAESVISAELLVGASPGTHHG